MEPIENIATYVFFDFSTVSLSDRKITELHMKAIRCEDIRKYFQEAGAAFYAKPPADKNLHWILENDALLCENREDDDMGETTLKLEASRFLKDLEKPVCFIAHNGNRFDFVLLRNELADEDGDLPIDYVCADSMAAFYDIFEPDAQKTSYKERGGGSFPWPDYYFDKQSYKLEDVYERNVRVEYKAENAKDRNNAVVEIVLELDQSFMAWVDKNNMPLTHFLKPNLPWCPW